MKDENAASQVVEGPQDSQALGFGEQDAYGTDISLLRANLRLTPQERLEKHQRALRLVREIRRAGQNAGLHRRSDGA